jgi:hypothetical protein
MGPPSSCATKNDYTLTLQDGSWRIVADAHPIASADAPTAAGSTSPATTNAADKRLGRLRRDEWPLHGRRRDVDDSHVRCIQLRGGVSATWVGIGGVNSRDLIQAGTQQQTTGTGQTQYQAWVEMLPQASRKRAAEGESW